MTSAYDIKAEIVDWSHEVLEVACDAYAGLPPCPFARKAWIDSLVTVEVVDNISEIIMDAHLADKESENVMIYALIDSGGMTIEQLESMMDEFNAIGTGIWIMGSHHEAPDNELMPYFEARTDVEYAFILVQSLKHLVIASDKLRKTRYYENFNPDDMAYINRRKEKCKCVE